MKANIQSDKSGKSYVEKIRSNYDTTNQLAIQSRFIDAVSWRNNE